MCSHCDSRLSNQHHHTRGLSYKGTADIPYIPTNIQRFLEYTHTHTCATRYTRASSLCYIIRRDSYRVYLKILWHLEVPT